MAPTMLRACYINMLYGEMERMSKKEILFAAQNLNIGGVQKAFVNYLKKLSESGEYEISVFAFTGGMLSEKLPKNIKTEYGEKRNKKYDIAVSYFTDIPTGVFNKGTNLYISDFVNAGEKYAFIHTDPVFGGFDKEYCRRIYEPFDKIICVSDAVREKFNAFLPEYADKTKTQHNVFDEKEIKELAQAYEPFEKSKFDIVTVARIDDASKRIDGIINICYQVKRLGLTNFKWRIGGDGPDMKRNIGLAKKMGVEDIVIFEGEKTNPYPYIYNSDLFALFSAYEGYPLVIGEAMILKRRY